MTVNVGVVSGGTRANVVAHDSRAQVQVRLPTVERSALLALLILAEPHGRPVTAA